MIMVPAHDYTTVSLGGGVKQWTISPGGHQQSTPAHQTTHVVVLNESDLTVTPSHGPGALVDEKDPTTELQPNAPHIDVPPPQVTVTESPSFTGTGQPVPNEVPPQLGPSVSVPNPQAPGPEQKVDVPVLVPQVPTEVTAPQGPVVVPGPEQKVDVPVLVPQVPTEVTAPQGPVVVPGPEQKVDVPVLVPQVPTEVTAPQGPAVVPGPEQKVDVPVLVPQVPTEVTAPQGPAVVPGPEQKVDVPVLVPQVPDQGTPVSVPNPQAPGPEQKLEAPSLLPPPVRGQGDEYTQSSIPAVVTSVVTPEGVVDVGTVVAPGVTSDVVPDSVTPAGTGTSGTPVTTTNPTTEAGVATTVGHGPTSPTTHHHTSPTGLTDGTSGLEHHAPAGELAHTGGNTAILAIVAGSLLAAGAGLAVAGRMGKDDPDTGATEG